jgi:hypothetical protein
MKKILIQLWEIYNIDGSVESDGCSLHIDLSNRNNYLNDNFSKIERNVGSPSEVEITDKLYSILELKKNIRLSEVEMNNLLSLNDITIVC